jgi:pyruvate,orthophosphate dikinase
VRIDGKAGTLSVRGTVVKTGETITLDGSTGEIILGIVPTVQPELSGDFSQLMEWADEFRKLGIRTNAETPTDAAQARKFGAEGIGLCRTEHMFFEGDRIVAVREMILADDEKSRRTALAKIQPMQRQDFVELFEIMAGLPVTIRLLDPPLHEFLPKTQAEMEVVAKDLGVELKEVEERANKLHEFNPMLGHRGVRLGISFPEIYEMQARAIFEAVAEVQKKAGKTVIPEIMIPLVATKKELDLMKVVIDRVAEEVSSSSSQKLEYLVGTMIELPRAALRAGDIAESAEFFSFGTNDLTQTTFGLSRDDSASFLEKYQQRGIFEHDPFASLDIEGVGELIEIATERGRKVRNSLKLGICGEHGGDPASVFFCHKAGLDYVSCSPYRVPIARLAAAQAALGGPLKTE